MPPGRGRFRACPSLAPLCSIRALGTAACVGGAGDARPPRAHARSDGADLSVVTSGPRPELRASRGWRARRRQGVGDGRLAGRLRSNRGEARSRSRPGGVSQVVAGSGRCGTAVHRWVAVASAPQAPAGWSGAAAIPVKLAGAEGPYPAAKSWGYGPSCCSRRLQNLLRAPRRLKPAVGVSASARGGPARTPQLPGALRREAWGWYGRDFTVIPWRVSGCRGPLPRFRC